MPARSYRKKPIVIEAIQFTGHNGWEIEAWTEKKAITSPVLEPDEDNPSGAYMQIKTLKGVMIVNAGDWIIRGVADEYYPCRDDVFQKTYEDAVPHDGYSE